MAGFYSDVPGPRIPYDVNGSEIYYLDYGNSSVIGQMDVTLGQKVLLNADRGYGLDAPNRRFCLILPHTFDISGIYIKTSVNVFESPHWSSDTTNGMDGTWTATSVPRDSEGDDNPVRTRTQIQTVSWSACRAIRFWVGGSGASVWYFHVYGVPSSGTNPNSLRLWHPSTDTELTDGAYFDAGDNPRLGEVTKTFRIKNISSTLTANTVSIASPTNTRSGISPTLSSQIQYAVGAGGYGSSASLGTLAPGGISSVVSLRYQVNASAQLGLNFAKFIATAASWS